MVRRYVSGGLVAGAAVAALVLAAQFTPTAQAQPAAAAPAAAAAAPTKYSVDAVHSAVIFSVKHFNAGYTFGRFNDFTGSIVLDSANPANSSIEVVVKTESVDTANAKRDQHLRNADFFNAKQFPTITFKSTSIKPLGDDKFELKGTLTLNGKTQEITAPFVKTGEGKDPWGGYRVGGEATFSVKRSDFGITYMPDGIGDEVRLIISIEGIKEEAKK